MRWFGCIIEKARCLTGTGLLLQTKVIQSWWLTASFETPILRTSCVFGTKQDWAAEPRKESVATYSMAL